METITLNCVDVKHAAASARSHTAILRATTVAAPRSSIPSTPLHIETVVDHVYASLREGILDGTLPHGSRLPQGSLAQDFGVSRTPLREALRRLATEGLVVFSPNRGATVSDFDFGDRRQVWVARAIVEPGAARLAADTRDPAMIGRMRDAIARQREVGNDPDASCSANREFHLALAAASRNPHLKRFVEMLWVPGIGVIDDEIPTAQPSHEMLGPAGDHERILEAVCAGDATLAEHLTRNHVAEYPPLPPAPR
jgi:DNA-binding GntR family transcriptional regulator